ncbi:MAG: TetR/AcrR family transcriptional regulator [Chloroflexi bacterium]|nr:TetR/AcrR family transcriptional regulator [Chloroflexota bacterium]
MEPTDAYHHGDLRTACIAAGVRLVAQGGVEAVTIRGVARSAHVSHTAPLHHFRDRDELLGAVAQAGFDGLIARAAEVTRDATDPVDRVRRYAHAYLRGAIDDPGMFRLMFGAAACDVGYEAYALLHERAASSALGGRDPDGAALMIWAEVHGLASLYAEGKLRHELDGLGPADIPPRASKALDRLLALLSTTGDLQ